jgi:hypothetical protein
MIFMSLNEKKNMVRAPPTTPEKITFKKLDLVKFQAFQEEKNSRYPSSSQ